MEGTGALALIVSLLCSGLAAWFWSRIACGTLCERRERSAENGEEGLTFAQRMESLEARALNALMRVPAIRVMRGKTQTLQRRRQLRNSMPQAIHLLCIALDSSASLNQALAYAAQNSSGAISRELKRAVWDVKAGKSFQEAMEALRMRTGEGEFACLSVAMEIQHSCGGTLSTILTSVSQMLEQSAALEDELVTKTTQAQLSAKVVAVMPVVVLVLLTLVSPGFIGQFFQTPAGVAILLLAVLLEVAGAVLVKRSLAIDTGVGAMGI